MPVYNAGKYVERALLSALNQTYEQLEIIVVNDGSSDNSMTIVERVIAAHAKGNLVRVIELPENGGVSEARNAAIDAASGQYLYFMDSDDEITADCIQKLYDEITRSAADLIYGSLVNVSSGGNRTWEIIYHQGRDIYTFPSRPMYVWNILFDMDFLREQNIRFLSTHIICEDVYFILQVFLMTTSTGAIPDITYTHFQDGESLSNGVWSEKKFSTFFHLFADQAALLHTAQLSRPIRILYKRKLFWFRVWIAEMALQSPPYARPVISEALSTKYVYDRGMWRNATLIIGFLVSILPLWGKILFLKAHLWSVATRRKKT